MGNTTQDTVLAARELNPAQTSGDSWYNRHVVYTHGYGVIAAYGNQVDSAGNRSSCSPALGDRYPERGLRASYLLA